MGIEVRPRFAGTIKKVHPTQCEGHYLRSSNYSTPSAFPDIAQFCGYSGISDCYSALHITCLVILDS